MYMPTRKNGDFQTYQKIKHMETCRNNQELFQYALNLPDMNIQNLPLMRYVIQRNVILGKKMFFALLCHDCNAARNYVFTEPVDRCKCKKRAIAQKRRKKIVKPKCDVIDSFDFIQDILFKLG